MTALYHAGGALSSTTADIWKNFLANSQERPKLIDKIVQFTKENNLDGVDVDVEGVTKLLVIVIL